MFHRLLLKGAAIILSGSKPCATQLGFAAFGSQLAGDPASPVAPELCASAPETADAMDIPTNTAVERMFAAFIGSFS